MSCLFHKKYLQSLKTGCILVALLFIIFPGKAQTKEFYVSDKSSKQPIPYVNVFCPTNMEGSISNADGKVRLDLPPKDTLLFSCVGYRKRELVFNTLGDTVYLTPVVYDLNNVTVYGVDLREKILAVAKNYFRLYVKNSRSYECTYKESFKVDDTLKRLTQVQIRWWDKSYNYDFKKPIDKKEEVSVTNVDYSKKVLNGFASGGYMGNDLFFEYLHLNHYLFWILNYAKDIVIHSVEKQENYTEVAFSASIKQNGKLVSSLKNAVIYFDNKTGAILKFSYDALYHNQIKKGISSKGINYMSSVHREITSISFVGLPNHKLALSFFRTQIFGELKVANKTQKFSETKELFVTKVEKGKRILRDQRIDLKGPLFNNFPSHKKTGVRIPLTNEESEFMDR